MDRGTLIIGVIVLLACFLPLLLVYMSRKKQERLILKYLEDHAHSKNSIIDTHDLWSNTAIGIDSNKHILYFLRKTSADEIVEINLKDVQKCKLSTTKASYNEKGSKESISKIDLVFTYSDTHKPVILLEFYNTRYDNLTLNSELQLAEKWEKIVGKELSGIKQ
jgi:hypothetical protein